MKWNIFGKEEYKEIVQEKDESKLIDLFAEIQGYEKEKRVTLKVLESSYPTHTLYYGEPGTGKSLFGQCMANHKKLKGKVEFRTAARMTKAGLSDFLMKYGSNLRVLFIDEIEYLSKKDQSILLSLMETGVLEVTVSGKDKKKSFLKLIIMATCNNPKKLLEPLFDRFLKIKMEPYTEEQFTEIARARLTDFELPQNIIEEIIRITLEYVGPKMRTAVNCAKLRPRTLDEIIEFMEVGQ